MVDHQSPQIRRRGGGVSKNYEQHGLTGTKIYHLWNGMKARCGNPRHSHFPHYGGRGIYVCDEWRKSLLKFIEDMGERPSDNHQIDRINNDGPYCKENCRWVTRTEQARNRSDNKFYEVDGKTQCLQDWATESGINTTTLRLRINRSGLTMEQALEFTHNVYLTVDGITKTQKEWCNQLGLNPSTVCQRIKRGLSDKKALGLS